jgi:hypothetical protein
MSTSEAKMEIYQNARVLFDMLARDLASVQVYDSDNPPTNPAQTFIITRSRIRTNNNEYFLAFNTITSWRNTTTNARESGVARVDYSFTSFAAANGNVCRLERNLSPISTNAIAQSNVLGEFIFPGTSNPRMLIEYYDKSITNFREPGSLPNNMTFRDPGSLTASTTDNLPSSIRITMDLTDRNRRIIRTVSRVFWIATGGN